MEIKLKPCPFCGGEAYVVGIDDNEAHFLWAACRNCGGMTFKTEKEAIEAWNRRSEGKTQAQYQIVLPIEIANKKELDHIRSWLAYTDAACAMLITLIEGAEKELKRYRTESRDGQTA